MARKNESNLVVVCHNIRSAWNVGSIFRTADGVGVAKVYLTGYTPAPPHPGISKTALGAEKIVAWEKFAKLETLLKKLKPSSAKASARKKEKYEIVALEQDEKSISINSYKSKRNIALILGNEVRGLNKATLSKCDQIIEIPMRGEKESLNVSVAFGIAAYSIIFKAKP
ncbi:MAG TPA: TrmH family RNA methyltransferase [Candidatus Bathyarchaeia archaeon]|nr:TrmH family RNA methyltransferase [Candidatus Bathyarchaeia archaeon]